MSLCGIHGLTAVAGGSHLVVDLGVSDSEPQSADCALVVDLDLSNVLGIRLFGARCCKQVYCPHRHRKDADGDEQGNYVLQLAEPLDDGGVGQPAAFAHGLQAVSAPGAL